MLEHYREPGTSLRRSAAAKRKSGAMTSPSKTTNAIEKSIKLEQHAHHESENNVYSANDSAAHNDSFLQSVGTAADSKEHINISATGQPISGCGIPPLASSVGTGNTNTVSISNNNTSGNSSIRDSDDTDDEDFAKSKMTGRYLSVSFYNSFLYKYFFKNCFFFN